MDDDERRMLREAPAGFRPGRVKIGQSREEYFRGGPPVVADEQMTVEDFLEVEHEEARRDP